MEFKKLTVLTIIAALILLGCTSGPTPAANTTANGVPTAAAGLANIVKGTLDSSENFSATISYDRVTRQAVIEAIQPVDPEDVEQLPFVCAISSTFLVLINDARIYGESGKINGTLQIRLPPEKYDQYVAGSGLTKAEFDAMDVTSAAIRFQDRGTKAAVGECLNIKGRSITLDGKELKTEDINEAGRSGSRINSSQATPEVEGTETAATPVASEAEGNGTTETA